MGGGGKNGASREAAQARADEEARQARIRAGTASINKTFDGGVRGTGSVATGTAFDPTKTYYRADGSVWTPPKGMTPSTGAPAKPAGGNLGGVLTGMAGGGSTKPASSGGGSFMGLPMSTLFGGQKPGETWDSALGSGLYTGTETTGGFNDQFFDGVRKSFVDFARPQLDDQFRKASEQGTFALARSGTLDSSMRGEQNAEMQKQYDINLQDVTDKARGYETEARNNVERARSDLISMLQVTGDATGAANSAASRAATLATPPAYSPLGQLFQDSTSILGQQMAQERAFALGLAPRPRSSVGSFGPNSGSVKVSN
jgi:hypothetical protein